MRVSEVDEQLADQYVSLSCNGGVSQSNDDNTIVVRNNNYNFSLPGIFMRRERHSLYLNDVFGNLGCQVLMIYFLVPIQCVGGIQLATSRIFGNRAAIIWILEFGGIPSLIILVNSLG
jgi:hypothetical protein